MTLNHYSKDTNIIANMDLDDEFAESWDIVQNTTKPDNIEIIPNIEQIEDSNSYELLLINGEKILQGYMDDKIMIDKIDKTMIIDKWNDILTIHKHNNDFNKDLESVKKIVYAANHVFPAGPRLTQKLMCMRIAKGYDMIGQAPASYGKTATYIIGSLLKIDQKLNKTQLLIISPTQPLAIQIAKDVKRLTIGTDLTLMCYIGGVPFNNENRNPQIIVGCLGRVLDLQDRKKINLQYLKTLILDEGDILLNRGFIEQIEKLITSLLKNVQICFFSATINSQITNCCDTFLDQKNCSRVLLPTGLVITRLVMQWYIECDTTELKNSSIIDIINNNPNETIIIFFNSCQQLINISELLTNIRPPIKHFCIHGRLDNKMQILNSFNEGKCNVLFASDIIARGIDIPIVSIIINYDVPFNDEIYIHRIGRSGRGDVIGNSITLVVSKAEKNRLDGIIKIYKEPIKKLVSIKFNR